MPRPEQRMITLSIDGIEVTAPENAMLVDAAKQGDIEILAGVQDQIMGNCLCVLGDSMAMPISAMVSKFRDEFEAHIEAARERNGLGAAIPQVNRGRNAGPGPMREPSGVDPTAAVV